MARRCVREGDVPCEKQGVVAVADTDYSLGVIHIQVDHQEGLHPMEAHHLGGDDVEEPPAGCGFCEIDDAVGEQHRPIDGVAMPIFCADKSGKVCS